MFQTYANAKSIHTVMWHCVVGKVSKRANESHTLWYIFQEFFVRLQRNWPLEFSCKALWSYLQQLAIRINDLELEDYTNCEFDKLEIYDGAVNTDDRLARLCDEISDVTFITRSNKAIIEFSSDGNYVYRGFNISYNVIRSSTSTPRSSTETTSMPTTPPTTPASTSNLGKQYLYLP